MNGSPLVILLVEDNLDHAELAKRNLEECHVANRIFHIEDGEAAIHYMNGDDPYSDRERYPRPDLVLLDLRLPKIDGLEVLRIIKLDPDLRAIPVVVLTTSDAEPDIARAYQLHANSYLTKPVAFDALSRLLKDLGFYWLAWNKRPW